jgi:hypothetical protein
MPSFVFASLIDSDLKIIGHDRGEFRIVAIFPRFIKRAYRQVKGNGFKRFLIAGNTAGNKIEPGEVSAKSFHLFGELPICFEKLLQNFLKLYSVQDCEQ